MRKIRGKPDLSTISAPTKDPSEFLDGALGDLSDKNKEKNIHESGNTKNPPIPTVQKLFRLRWDVANALKEAAREESIYGYRVTETEIVERLLKQYFNFDS